MCRSTHTEKLGSFLTGSDVKSAIPFWSRLIAISISLEFPIDIYTLPCAKRIAGEKLLCVTQELSSCSVMTQKGGDGGGRRLKRGIYAYIELIHIVVQEKLTQHCKQ